MMAVIFCVNGEKKSLIRTIMSIGGFALLCTSTYLTIQFLELRQIDTTSEFLFTESAMWYERFNIHYSVGVDGISVAMLLLSSIVVITGVFVSFAREE